MHTVISFRCAIILSDVQKVLSIAGNRLDTYNLAGIIP
jgi:hypothetical protein